MLLLTNCTFDGLVYNVERVMEECLAIKPDLVFLWDEAWFAFARFGPTYRQRTGMHTAQLLRDRYKDPAYREQVRGPPGRDRRAVATRSCSTRACCPTPTRCGCASTRPSRRTRR